MIIIPYQQRAQWQTTPRRATLQAGGTATWMPAIPETITFYSGARGALGNAENAFMVAAAGPSTNAFQTNSSSVNGINGINNARPVFPARGAGTATARVTPPVVGVVVLVWTLCRW
jgi:hypothetical protein